MTDTKELEMLDKIRAYLDEHVDFSKQPNESSKDAYIYGLYKLIMREHAALGIS